jgi:signal transduction histidine kinase
MLEQRGEMLDPEVRADLAGRIRRQAERLRTLVDDLLTTSALDAGRFPVHPEPLRLAPLLADALAGLPESETATLCLDEDLWVVADPDRVEQIVANLLSNALRYGAPPVEVAARPEGDWVWLEVKDHGEGVPASFEPLLFERFTRGPGSAERSSQGTGLGLAIVAKLAELHGGQVAYRRDGDATVFAVSLPHLGQAREEPRH